ncbi:uncharacterized protein PG986_000263 [Apiospora aurea]|uniref:Uncharacterized protein n=1 Tax=Apiospora aurea TaxID=335848 RepID=A0ABR1QUH4_9PEZI
MKSILALIILASISAPSSVSAPMDDAKASESLTVTPSESTGVMPPGPPTSNPPCPSRTSPRPSRSPASSNAALQLSPARASSPSTARSAA